MKGVILTLCAVICIAEAYSSQGKPKDSFALRHMPTKQKVENYCAEGNHSPGCEEAQNQFTYSQETSNFSGHKVDSGYFENRSESSDQKGFTMNKHRITHSEDSVDNGAKATECQGNHCCQSYSSDTFGRTFKSKSENTSENSPKSFYNSTKTFKKSEHQKCEYHETEIKHHKNIEQFEADLDEYTEESSESDLIEIIQQAIELIHAAREEIEVTGAPRQVVELIHSIKGEIEMIEVPQKEPQLVEINIEEPQLVEINIQNP